MRLILLHDHLNPAQEVELDVDSITSVVAFGSGSSIECGQGVVCVHETPAEVHAATRRTE